MIAGGFYMMHHMSCSGEEGPNKDLSATTWICNASKTGPASRLLTSSQSSPVHPNKLLSHETDCRPTVKLANRLNRTGPKKLINYCISASFFLLEVKNSSDALFPMIAPHFLSTSGSGLLRKEKNCARRIR